MENSMFTVLIVTLSVSFVNLLVSGFVFFRTRSYAKDNAEAMKLVMSYLTKAFENNASQHQDVQNWTEDTMGKMVDLGNGNSQKIYNVISNQQVYLSRLGEFLGYRPRGNIDS